MTKFGLMILFLIFSALPVWAKPYEVIFIHNGSADIKDADKNKIFKIKAGEPLDDGWIVVLIEKDSVVIEKWINDKERIRSVLPSRIHREKRHVVSED